MINKDSIVTAYDEHLTLVEWLQKVEKALDNAVLINLGIAKLSDNDNVATYQVTATFADNTTIVSNTFTLPSTNIVTAFDNLTALVNDFDKRITDNTNDVASIIDIIDISNDKIKSSTLQNSINGSDDVIVDVDATNNKLEIHLSAELQAKLARVLLKPLTPPSTRKVVTIGTNGAQDNVDGTELTTLMDNIVDSHGNARFIEGVVTMETFEGGTQKYGKWTLSGSHLMIVLVGEVSAGNILPETIGRLVLPNWLKNKIVRITGDAVSYSKIFIAKKSTSGGVPIPAEINCILLDWITNYSILGTETTAKDFDRVFRVQFDLVIN